MKSTLISWDGSIILKFEQYGFTIHLHVCIQKMQHLCIQKMQLHVNVEWQTRPKTKVFVSPKYPTDPKNLFHFKQISFCFTKIYVLQLEAFSVLFCYFLLNVFLL